MGDHGPYKGILKKPPNQQRKHSHCECTVIQSECQTTFWDTSGSHLAGYVYVLCLKGNTVTSVLFSGLCELTNNAWDYCQHHLILHACHLLLSSPNFNQKTPLCKHKAQKHTHMHTTKLCGIEGPGMFLWCQWHFWTSMTNAVWPIGLSPSLYPNPLNFSPLR